MAKKGWKRTYKPERARRKVKRDTDICNRFDELCNNHPEWRFDAIFDKIAAEFYLSPATIYHIVNNSKKSEENNPS